MAQQDNKVSGQQAAAPLKHKLCRWKDSWSRDSQGGGEVVHEEAEESVGGCKVAKRMALSSPSPQAQEAAAGVQAPAAPLVAEPEPLKKIRVTAIRKKRSREVLFIEAGKDLVDVVVGFLLLPGWAIVRVLKSESRPAPTLLLSSLGCIGNVYSSVRDMDPALLLVDKSSLLKGEGTLSCLLPALIYLTAGTVTGTGSSTPTAAGSTGNGTPHYSSGNTYNDRFIYGCHGRYVANGVYGPGHQPCPWIAFLPGILCPTCGSTMTLVYGQVGAAIDKPAAVPALPLSPNAALAAAVGSVKEAVTFMLTDILEIFPTSGVRSMELLNKKRWLTGDLEKVQLELGHMEVKKLMELSLTSETALTETLCPLMQ